MIGGVIGDFVGSVFEGRGVKSYNFQCLTSHLSRITDDTVLLCGTAEAIMTDMNFVRCYRKWGRKYLDAEFSIFTHIWVQSDTDHKNGNPGNGPASRAGIIGYLDLTESEILKLARESAMASHSHEESIAGAEAVALCIYYLRHGVSIESIKAILYEKFEYFIDYDLDELNRNWWFDCSAFNTVPLAIYIGLTAKSYEDAIRNCLYIGGDTDTMSCISGLVAQSRLGVCEKLKLETQRYLFKEANDVLLTYQQFEALYL